LGYQILSSTLNKTLIPKSCVCGEEKYKRNDHFSKYKHRRYDVTMATGKPFFYFILYKINFTFTRYQTFFFYFSFKDILKFLSTLYHIILFFYIFLFKTLYQNTTDNLMQQRKLNNNNNNNKLTNSDANSFILHISIRAN
jgi:hypothetical protein